MPFKEPLTLVLSSLPLPLPKSSVTPHLSPSFSTSVNSSSLSNPEGNNLSHPAQLSGTKFHASNRSHPWTRSISPHAASDIPSSPLTCSCSFSLLLSHSTRHIHTHSLAAQQAMARRIHPYDPRSTATPLELHFTTWALGHPSHISRTLEDVSKM